MKQLVIAAMLFIGLSMGHAQVISQWTFENDSVATNPTPAPSTGSGTAQSLGMTNTYTVGGSAHSSTDASAILVSTQNPDLTNVWRIVGTNGWNSGAPIGTQGAQFNVSTVGFTNITFAFDVDITAQGEANLQLQYTTDGSTWNNTPVADFTSFGITNAADGIFTPVTNTGSDANSVTGGYLSAVGQAVGNTDTFFQGVTANFSSITAANNDPNFGIRIVNASTGTDDVALKESSGNPVQINNTSGNWRLDNITFSGTSSVPEPSTYALILGGAVMLIVIQLRRRSL
jgi:hypothetical protein